MKSESESMNFDRDRISSLPDDLLSHIISFLPIKLALTTRILSTRWRYLRISIDNLILNDANAGKIHWWKNSVRKPPCIRRVRFVLSRFADRTCHNSWIRAAMECNIEEIVVSASQLHESVKIPKFLFRYKNLVFLTVQNCYFRALDSVCCPRLKYLKLDVSNQYLNGISIVKIVSGSPVLEELVIYGNIVKELQGTLNIQSLSLKTLEIHQFGDISKPCSCWINGLGGIYEASVDAPKLEIVKVSDFIFKADNMKLLSLTLVSAAIQVTDTFVEFAAERMARFLEQISIVKDLCFSSYALKAVSGAPLPTFWNLTHLHLTVDGAGNSVLPGILQSSPNLEVLILKKFWDEGKDDCIWSFPDRTPLCLLCSLGAIELEGFELPGAQLEMIEYFLKNSMVLNKLVISSWRLDPAMKPSLHQKLSMFPKGSSKCQIVFSDQ